MNSSYITVGKTRINLSSETQISPQGRPFRISSTQIVLTEQPVWTQIGRLHSTIYTFRYLDTTNEFFSLKMDANNKFVCKI